MGSYPTVIENTIEENLSDEFWKDLLTHVAKGNDCVPDNFWGIDEHWSIEDMKGEAFQSDHQEHIGSWLWDKCVQPILQKHKVNGRFVLHHEDSGGYYHGIIFHDGVAFDAKVETKIGTGEFITFEEDC